MKMARKQYRIGELAKELNVERFVIRFWEKELHIKPRRSPGGQRFYQQEDFDTFKTIKTLLYDHKFTLAGAKKKLAELKQNPKLAQTPVQAPTQKVIVSKKTDAQEQDFILSPILHQKLIDCKNKLKKFKELL